MNNETPYLDMENINIKAGKELQKTIVWYSLRNGGDGSAYPAWYLTEKEAEWDQDNMSEGWGEPCTGSVETFIGSDIYNDALETREQNQKLFKAKKEGIKLPEGEYDEAYKLIILEENDKNLAFLNESPIEAWGLNCK